MVLVLGEVEEGRVNRPAAELLKWEGPAYGGSNAGCARAAWGGTRGAWRWAEVEYFRLSSTALSRVVSVRVAAATAPEFRSLCFLRFLLRWKLGTGQRRRV